MNRRRFRSGIRFYHWGDLRRAHDASTGRVVEFSRPATRTVDGLLRRSADEPDPEIEAVFEAHSLLEPTLSRRDSLVISGSAAGLISTFLLPSAVAAASTGVAFADADDGGAVTTSIIEVDGIEYDLYEIKYTLTGTANNATITRSMTLGGDTAVDLLLVGGGGAGGSFAATGYGGGGGAGELVDIRGLQLVAGLYTITVGAGGTVGSGVGGGTGTASSLRLNGAGSDTAYAAGGGGGGGQADTADAGGSSGGRESGGGTALPAGTSSALPTTPADASSAESYVFAGGAAVSDAGGGGGGAGGAGGAGNSGAGGPGGSGRSVGGGAFLAAALTLAVGGGGAGASSGGDGRSASSGDGADADQPDFAGRGLNGTGDGGGGGLFSGGNTLAGGRGATGIAFVRVPR